MYRASVAPVAAVLCFTFGAISFAQQQYVGRARIVDGDTIVIGTTTIRMFGIDAPEKNQTCLSTKGQRYQCGQRSTEHLKRLIGTHVVACTDLGRSSNGRRRGRCVANGVNLEAAMVVAGHARTFAAHSLEYSGAENAAKAKRLGIWQGEHRAPGDVRLCKKRGGGTIRACS